jgi:apolipoprotein N-acyltransferase
MQTSLKIITALSCALAAYFIGKEMAHIPLWGDWTLYLLLTSWVAILTVWSFGISRMTNKDKLVIYSVIGGVLLWLGFPPMPTAPFLLFVGLLPMLYVEQYIALSHDKTAKWEVFKFAFVSFLTWNILATWWVGNSSIVAGIIANIANALLMCIPWVLFHATKKRLGDTLGYLSLIAFWLTFEYIHLRWDFIWPWLCFGNAFAQTPSLVQWYDVTGYSGGSLWVLAVNVLAFRFSLHRTELSMRIHWVNFKKIWIPVIIIIVPMLISLLIYHTFEMNKTLPPFQKEVVIVQPNYEPHYQKFDQINYPDSKQLQHYLALARTQVTDKTDYLVFPETSFESVWLNEIEAQPTIRALHQFVDSFPHLKLITGLGSYKIYRSGEPEAETAHHGPNFDYESYNSAEQISSHQTVIPHYFKTKMVPGIERLPYFQYLGFLAPLTAQFGGTPTSLGIGKPDVFWDENHKTAAAPLICYESICGEFATAHVRLGANFFCVITNDGWWDKTPGYLQHLEFSSLRAIETRRDIARSANTGVSAFINARGDILQATKYNESAAIKGNIEPRTDLTFYVRFGDYIARLGVLVSIGLLLYSLYKRFAKA